MKKHHEPHATFVRHVMKIHYLEHRTMRTFEVKRSRGRLIEKIMDSVTIRLEKKDTNETFHCLWDRGFGDS